VDLLEKETVNGSGISWAICISAPRPRQITMPAPYHIVFYKLDALPASNQQRQSTEGTNSVHTVYSFAFCLSVTNSRKDWARFSIVFLVFFGLKGICIVGTSLWNFVCIDYCTCHQLIWLAIIIILSDWMSTFVYNTMGMTQHIVWMSICGSWDFLLIIHSILDSFFLIQVPSHDDSVQMCQ